MRHLLSVKVFATIAEEGAISRAARRLKISTATGSAHLDALEVHLGGRLFIRSTRRLILTEFGRLYLKHIKPVLDSLAEADRLAESYQGSPQGLLKVTTGTSMGRLLIAPAIGQFRAQYPDLKVYLNLNDSIRHLLDEGFDLAIRTGDCDSGDLIRRKLAPNQQVLVASPDYLANAPPLTAPVDLKDHALLLHADDNESLQELKFRVNGISQSFCFEGTLSSNNAELLGDWAIRGYGVTQKSLWEVAAAIKEKKLLRLLSEYEPEPINFFAVAPYRTGESPRVDKFVEFLRLKLRESPLTSGVRLRQN